MGNEVARFKRVLHIRETERDISQSGLAAKEAEEEAILKGLNATREKKENALAEFCSGEERVISRQQLWFERQNLDIIDQDLDSQNACLEHCRHEIEEKKDELLERHRIVQLMDKYVDKLKARDFKKALAAEQNNLDDITAMRYLRGMKREART